MSLKKAYLYLVSVISLVIFVVGAIQLLDMGLKTWVFTKADRDYYSSPCYSSKAVPGTGSVECTPEEEAAQKKQQDDLRTAQKQRQASTAIAMIVVASPLWWYHWKMARKEV